MIHTSMLTSPMQLFLLSLEVIPQWTVILIIGLAVVIVIICVVAGTTFIVTLLGRSRWVGHT